MAAEISRNLVALRVLTVLLAPRLIFIDILKPEMTDAGLWGKHWMTDLQYND